MCGIVGFYSPGGFSLEFGRETALRLTSTLVHRGPDDLGTWVDGAAGVGLGHRRLSVLDLSAAGKQPMVSESGTYTIVFNGEVYNHLAIRRELEMRDLPPVWRGHSDTETLLAAIDRWGLETTLKKTIGMYALALWNRKDRTLTLARDRMGEKPLYYGWQGTFFLFGSELKALRAHVAFLGEIDRDALATYFRRGFIPAPRSVYRGIFKLMPGTYLRLSASDGVGAPCEPQGYWSIQNAITGTKRVFAGSDNDAIDELDERLKEAVALQCVADVPIGAFLSGGVDSTVVAALMQTQSIGAVNTFTIGFHEAAYNEASYAKSIAQVLGTKHRELYVSPHEAMRVVPKLPELYDEPFGDSSAIPTFLLAQLARREVTVSLSGDGGDELFGGYSRYPRTLGLWNALHRLPMVARRILGAGGRVLSQWEFAPSVSWKASRLASYLSAHNLEQFYSVQLAQHHGEPSLVVGSSPDAALFDMNEALGGPQEHPYETMMRMDALAYLPDDILFKVDRASMGVSLETRIPMLDHRIVEFAWQLPLHMKVRDGQGKWLLKQLLRRYVPDSLIDRPKKGFGVPIGDWVRHPLREWAEDLLAEGRLRREGFLDPAAVRKQWLHHVNRNSNRGDSIWTVLMFQAWLARLS